MHIFWITSRAAGVTALLLAGLSVAAGLLLSSPRFRDRGLRPVHEALALATLAAIGAHAGALLLDPWLKPGLPGILIPFQIAYRPVAVAAGIVAAYGLAFLGLTYYLRSRIGPAAWRKMHRFTALFWALGVLHGLTAGSDAGAAWFLAAVGAVTVPAAFLLVGRLHERSSGGADPGGPAGAAVPGALRPLRRAGS